MSFSRFAIGFPRHRKVAGLSDAAFRLWVSAIDYAREQLTEGELAPRDIDILPRAPQGKKRVEVVSEIVACGLWLETSVGWRIHDFNDWQDSPDEVRSKREAARDRMRRVRETRSQSVRANFERTSREVLLTTSYSLSSSSQISSSSEISSSLQLSSEGSDRSPARPVKKPAKSPLVPFELPEDWTPPADYTAVLVAKYSLPESRIAAELPDFRYYWRQGQGAGKKSTAKGWVQCWGNNITRLAKTGALFAEARTLGAVRLQNRPVAASDDELARARNNLLDDAKAGRFGAKAKARADSGENLGRLADDLEKWQRERRDKQLGQQLAPLMGGLGR